VFTGKTHKELEEVVEEGHLFGNDMSLYAKQFKIIIVAANINSK
jgi:hypothetical protein